MVIVAVFQSVSVFRSEIMSAGNFREIDQVAGVQLFLPGRSFQIGVRPVFHVVAVTGRTDHSAGSAVQTFIAPLFPYGRVKLDIEKARQDGNLDIGLEAVLDQLTALDKFTVIFICRIAYLEFLEIVEGFL